MKSSLFIALALGLAACSMPALPESSAFDPQNPAASVSDAPYQPVMAGTANHAPAGLKPWRELNDSVAPMSGRSP